MILLTLLFFLILTGPAHALPAWVEALPLNQWYQIPNTKLSSVDPVPTPPGITGTTSKIIAWNGAALKRSGSVYIIGMAGGHADYFGNEIDALQLNTTTPQWVQVGAPSPSGQMIAGASFYLDLKGSPTHTYFSAQFNDSRNRFMVMPSQTTSASSGVPDASGSWPYLADLTWTPSFNFGNNTWDPPTYVGRLSTSAGDSWTAQMVTKHQTTSDIYLSRDDGGFWKLDNSTLTWSQVGSTSEFGYSPSAMDPTRNRILILSDYPGTRNPRVRDLTGAAISATFTGLGSSVLQSSYAAVYDEVNDAFLSFDVQGGQLVTYKIDASTWNVTQLSTTGSNPGNRVNGYWNAIQYVPELGGVVVATDIDTNVYFMRLSGASAPVIVTSLTLNSPTTGTKAFQVGHVFKQGDVPSGKTILSSSAATFQASIKNAWPDGSAKFAILSGTAAVTANVPKVLTLESGDPPGGSALTESNLTATGITASIQFGSTCTVNLTSLIGTASTFSAGRWTSGRVRTWVSGPVMSSWIYYSRCGSDAHLSLWFEVRLFSNGAVEVIPWVENSTILVASPGERTGTVTFTLGGTQRYTASLLFPHHTRAMLSTGSNFSHWLGTDPQITPAHNTVYMQSTKMTATYRGNALLGTTLWSNFNQTYSPLTAANIPYTAMSGAGYATWIGLIPEWEAAYLASNGDPRAWRGVFANLYSAGGLGIHYRDENTNQPLRFSQFPNLVLSGASGINGTGASTINTYTPTPTGADPGGWDTPHHPSLGYFAYLLSGAFYALEEAQEVSTLIFLQNTDSLRNFTEGIMQTGGGSLTTRGAGWALRSLAQSIAITPDGETLRTEFLNSWGSNMDWYHARYVAQANNPQGVPEPYGSYSGSGPYQQSSFMEDFFTMSVGFALDVVTGAPSGTNTKASEFFAWKARQIVGRLGLPFAPHFDFRDGASYTTAVSPIHDPDWIKGAGPWYSNFGDVYTYTAVFDQNDFIPYAATANTLRGGNFPETTSYWGNLQPAISYAVDHNVTGASASYGRMIGATNWSTLANGFNNNPIWGVMPRSYTPVVTPTAPTAIRVVNR